MALIADGLLIATCLTAALYCYVLSRRLKQFTSTEDGVGKQVRELNAALEETRSALKEAQSGAAAASDALASEVEKARKYLAQLRSANSAHEEKPTPTPSPRPANPIAFPDEPVEEFVAAGGTKLEAVAHGTPEAEPTDNREKTVSAELDDIDPADLNLEDMLAQAEGEQQLGFLPKEDDETEQDESSSIEAESGHLDEAQQMSALEGDGGELETLVNDSPPRPRRAPPEDMSGDNLLKVERMAL